MPLHCDDPSAFEAEVFMRGISGVRNKAALFASVIGAAVSLQPTTPKAATLITLYSFCKQAGCVDGSLPIGGLVMDSLGNLFGTTAFGGDHDCGTIFELV